MYIVASVGWIWMHKKSILKSTILIIFAGTTMIAHGLRMMMQGLLFPQSYYPAPMPTTIDFWFDWFFLFALGSIILYIGVKQWARWAHLKQKKKDSKNEFWISPT